MGLWNVDIPNLLSIESEMSALGLKLYSFITLLQEGLNDYGQWLFYVTDILFMATITISSKMIFHPMVFSCYFLLASPMLHLILAG